MTNETNNCPPIPHKCVHKKFGTIIYKKGGDLLTSVSWELGAHKYEPPEEAILLYTAGEKSKFQEKQMIS